MVLIPCSLEILRDENTGDFHSKNHFSRTDEIPFQLTEGQNSIFKYIVHFH